jgi:hypothetical protein
VTLDAPEQHAGPLDVPQDANAPQRALDAFYPHLESDQVLKAFGPPLRAEARAVLTADPTARVAGLVILPDSHDAALVRASLAKVTGLAEHAGLLVGLVPRCQVEKLLCAHAGDNSWQEQGWQTQRVLPIVVSTRDGFRFEVLPLWQSAGKGLER